LDEATLETIENKQIESSFSQYPFPKNLKVVLKLGHYRLFDNESDEFEDIAATNAKEALTKSKFQKIKKIVYLGFIDKVILNQSEIINTATPTEVVEPSAKVETKTEE
jgi:hypothetical protein